MKTELKPCPFCGKTDKLEKEMFLDLVGWLYRVECNRCPNTAPVSMGSMEDAVKLWNTRPAEDALKAEVEELRYIVKKFEGWYNEDGCPKELDPDFPCSAETEYKNDPETEGDFDERDCWKEESDSGCWVEYYRWKFRQKIKSASAEKGEDDE